MSAASPLSVALVYDDSLDRPGGITQYLTMLARGLACRGHHVSHLVGATSAVRVGDARVHPLARNLSVRFNGGAATMPIMSRGRDIDSVLRAHTVDVLHVQVPYSPMLADRVIRRVQAHVAVVGTFHINSERLLPRLGARVLAQATNRSLRRFDRMICVSETAAGFARRSFGLADMQIVPNMIDGDALRVLAASRDVSGVPRPRLVFVGNLVPRKGVETLVAAMPAVVAEHPSATLVIAGEGPLRSRLMRSVRRAGLNAQVRFAGRVSEVEKAALLARADVACFPSQYGESFGVVLLEAIAAGAGVVVAAANAGYSEVLGATPSALARPRDPEDLAAVILRFLRDDALRVRVRDRQREIVAAYERDLVTSRVLDVYQQALAARRGCRAGRT